MQNQNLPEKPERPDLKSQPGSQVEALNNITKAIMYAADVQMFKHDFEDAVRKIKVHQTQTLNRLPR